MSYDKAAAKGSLLRAYSAAGRGRGKKKYVVGFHKFYLPPKTTGLRFFSDGQEYPVPVTQNPAGRGAGQAKAKPGGRGEGRHI